MEKTMKTWVSFVKDGKPTVANQENEWPEYDIEKPRMEDIAYGVFDCRKWKIKYIERTSF